MKVIDSMWFNTLQGSCGFVVGEDETTGKRQLYAGMAAGMDQGADEQAILGWGNKVNLALMEGLIAKAREVRPRPPQRQLPPQAQVDR